MRVAIVGPHPLDISRMNNGVEAVVVYLLEGMRALDGLELFVISGRHDIDRELVQKFDGYTVLFLPSPRRFGNITMGLMEKRRTRELLRELRPDVVHVHNHPNYPYLFSRPPFPTVTTIHGLIFKEVKFSSGFMDDLRKWPRVLHERLALKKIEEPAAVTPYVRDTIRTKTKARVHIMENPVSRSFFHINGLPTSKRILSVGRISRLKNFLDLIKCIRLLRSRVPEVELRVAGGVGDTAYLLELERYIEQFEMQSSVRFLGHLTEEELLQEYSSCAVVALASSEETAGMIFQQAMAAGKAVVATLVGGIPDIVEHGRTGLLVESGDIEGFADALAIILLDRNLQIRFGEAGRKEALKRFHPKMVALRTYSLYQQLINQAVCPCE